MEARIDFVKGDMFSYEADIRVNTVNCVGVMGAGVALVFKKKYPDMYDEYVRMCRNKEVRPGRPYIWTRQTLFEGDKTDIVINFPTKDHWRNPSEYEYIDEGLQWMRRTLPEYKGKTIAIPSLGCGHGGLEWARVRDMIQSYLKDIDMHILVFEPDSSSVEKELSVEEKSFILRKDIQYVKPSDDNYPICLKGRSAAEIFCRGSLNLIDESNSISIFIESKASEREFGALISCLDQMVGYDVTFILGLVHAREMDLLKACLERRFKVILVIPYGIMKMKLRDDVKALWDDSLITLISLQRPSAPWNRFAIGKATRFRLQISKKILIDAIDDTSVRYYAADLRNKETFFVNYWNDPNPFYASLNARPISRNQKTGMPVVKDLVM